MLLSHIYREIDSSAVDMSPGGTWTPGRGGGPGTSDYIITAAGPAGHLSPEADGSFSR